MQITNSNDLEKTLQDLFDADFPSIRRQAAYRLGQLLASSDEVVRALITAGTLDHDPGVRSAARAALQSPVHQAFLQAHPDFERMAADAATRARAEEQHRREEEIIREFVSRRSTPSSPRPRFAVHIVGPGFYRTPA